MIYTIVSPNAHSQKVDGMRSSFSVLKPVLTSIAVLLAVVFLVRLIILVLSLTSVLNLSGLGSLVGDVVSLMSGVIAVILYIQYLTDEKRKREKLVKAIRKRTSFHLNPAQAANINPIGRIIRPELSQVLRYLREGRSVMIRGDGGSGKTGLLALLMEQIDKDSLVLYLPADVLDKDLSSPEELGSIWYKYAEHPISVLESAIETTDKPAYLVIDEIDQLEASSSLSRLLLSFIDLTEPKENIFVIAVVRRQKSEQKLTLELRQRQFTEVELASLPKSTARDYLITLGVISPSDEIIDLATNLRNLSLIAELVNEGVDASQLGTSQTQLWERYIARLEHKEDSESALGVIDHGLAIAQAMLMSGRLDSAVPIDQAVKRLLSWGACIQSDSGRISFRYDELPIYLYARDAVAHRKSYSVVKSEVDDRFWRRVFNAILALALLKDSDLYMEFALEVINGDKATTS